MKFLWFLKTLIVSAVFLSFLPKNSFGQFTVTYLHEGIEKEMQCTKLSDFPDNDLTGVTMTDDYTETSETTEFSLYFSSEVSSCNFNLNGHSLNLNKAKLTVYCTPGFNLIGASDESPYIGYIVSENSTVITSWGPISFKNVTIESTSEEDSYLIENMMNIYFYANVTFIRKTVGSSFFASEADLNFDEFTELEMIKDGTTTLVPHWNESISAGFNLNDCVYATQLEVVDAKYFEAKYGTTTKYFVRMDEALSFTGYGTSDVTITLTKDYTRNSLYIADHPGDPLKNISVSNNVTVDLKGYSYKDTLTLDISKKFAFKNASNADVYAFFNLKSGADFSLDGGKYSFYTEIVSLQSDSKATLNSNVTFTTAQGAFNPYTPDQTDLVNAHTPSYTACIANNGGTLTIESGTYTYNSEEDRTEEHRGVYTTNGTTTITGGSFSGKDAVYVEKGKVEITGGTFTGTNNGIWVQEGDDVVIEDGTFSGTGTFGDGIGFNEMGSGTIKGGSFTGTRYGLAADRSGVNLFGGKFDGQTAAVMENEKVINLKDGETQYAFYDANDVMLYFPDETDEADKYIKLNPNSNCLWDGENVLKKATVKKAKPVISPSKLLLGENDEATVTVYNATDKFKFSTIPEGITITKNSDEKYTVKTSEGIEGGEYKIVATDGDDEITMVVNVKYKVSAIDMIKEFIEVDKEYDGGVYVLKKGTKNYISGSGTNFFYTGKSEENSLSFTFTGIQYDDSNVGDRIITAYIYIYETNKEYYELTDISSTNEVKITDAKIIKTTEYTLGVNADVIFTEDVNVNNFKNDNSDISIEKTSDGKIHIKTTDNIEPGTYTIGSDVYIVRLKVVPNSDITDIESEKWYNEDISLSALDYTNKVKEIFGDDITLSITVNGENKEIVEQEGENKVKFVVTDKDDILYSKEFIVLLDKTAPEPFAEAFVNGNKVEVVANDPTGEVKKYYFRLGAEIELNAKDEKEGVDKISGVKTAEYSWDGTNFTPFDYENNEKVSLLQGANTLYLKATDIAGNDSEVFSIGFTVFQPSTFEENSDEEALTSAPYYYASKNGGEDMSFVLNLNGNAIFAVTDSKENKWMYDASQDADVSLSSNNVITVKKSYLETLKPDEENVLYVYIAPFEDMSFWEDFTAKDYESQIMKINLDITYTVKISTGYRFSEPTDPEIESFCDGDSVMVTFSLDENYSSADYVSINKLEVPQQSLGTTLRFKVPENVLAGGNEKIAVEFFKDGYEANDIAVFPGNYPAQYNIKLYDDVLAVDNSKDLFLADMYHWYLDMVELEGKNRQFLDILNYIQDGVVHKFYVEVTDIDGYRFRVCPSDDFTIEPIQKAKVMKVNTYPNPAKSGERLFIELENFLDEDYKDIEILIYNQLGGIVQKLSDVEKITEVSLKEGFYNGVVLKDGTKILSFKIIVK